MSDRRQRCSCGKSLPWTSGNGRRPLHCTDACRLRKTRQRKTRERIVIRQMLRDVLAAMAGGNLQ